MRLAEKIENDDRWLIYEEPELDIVVWAVVGKTTSEMSRKADQLFEEAAKKDLHLSKLKVPVDKLRLNNTEVDSDFVTCLRSCLMKPEHLDWMEEIWKRI